MRRAGIAPQEPLTRHARPRLQQVHPEAFQDLVSFTTPRPPASTAIYLGVRSRIAGRRPRAAKRRCSVPEYCQPVLSGRLRTPNQPRCTWRIYLHRRHLSSSQAAVISLQVECLRAIEAKKRQPQGGRDAGRGRPKEKVSQRIEQPKARDEAAVITGTNRQYVSDAKVIQEKAPDLLERVKSGEITIPQAKREIRKQEVTQRLVELPSEKCRGVHKMNTRT